MRRLRLTVLLLAAVLGGGTASGAHEEGGRAAGLRLTPFASCGDLVAYGQLHALPLVGPWGISGSRRPLLPRAVQAPPRAHRPFSQTNVQVEGVDEPDMVKTDGSHLFAVVGTKLRIMSLAGRLRLLATLALDPQATHQLLLRGKRLLIVSRKGIRPTNLIGGIRSPTQYVSETTLTEVDVRRPGRPQVARTLTVDGAYIAARMVEGIVRLVTISSLPARVAFEQPQGSDEPARVAATVRNRDLLAAAGVESWLPRATFSDRRGLVQHRPLVQCRHVWRPADFSGLGLTGVTTLDLDRGLALVDSDAIFSDAEVVYASHDSLFVATERWRDRPLTHAPIRAPAGVRTMLHKFGTGGTTTRYRASGAVEGYLLSQWSLSEHEGTLRVASTERPTWWSGEPVQAERGSFVTALVEQGGKLVPVGRVEGLGRGERVYAVRFEGDVGYVVTFRVTDPLYTIDLSRPARPALRGALQVPGYSAYLHPVGPGLLLGVGQRGDEAGTLYGVQLSLFDVSDPRRPRRLQQAAFTKGSVTVVEQDHHAFLYWPAARLAVVPVQAADRFGPLHVALGYRIGRAGIELAGRVTHGDEPILRSVVVGDSLFTISPSGVKENGLRALRLRGWVAFADDG